MLAWCLNPFCRNRNKFEDKSLDATTCAQAKLLCVQFLHDSFVEVSYEGCHKHEDGVLCHKRFWQAIPTKSVVHDIEETFLATQKIVELHDVSYTWLIVVDQNTPISVLVSCCKQGVDQQFIHCVAVLKSYCFPEVDVYVVLSTVSSSIARSMVVCTAGVEGWVQGQVLHQVGCHIFNT